MDNKPNETDKTGATDKSKGPPIIIGLLTTPFYLWAITHVVLTRSTHDFICNSLYVILPLICLSLIVALFYWVKSGLKKIAIGELLGALFIAIIIAAIGATYYTVGAALKDLYLWFKVASLSKNGSIFLVVCITFISGLVLFYFRLYFRSMYGLTETMVGLVIAGYKFSTQSPTTIPSTDLYLALLTASVYLVVRGLDNVHQGLTKEPKDPFASKTFSLLKRIRTKTSLW